MTLPLFLKATQFLLILLLLVSASQAQNMNAEQLLEAAIQHHDPHQRWQNFNDTLIIEMTAPKQSPRKSTVVINIGGDYFYLKAQQNNKNTTYIVKKNDCELMLNDKMYFSETEAKNNNLNCDRANMLKNYYTYLYGLPMKIKDPGAIIQNNVSKTTFKGKEYLVLKVSYTEDVGDDVWFFYFNPKTFALEVYQFFKTDKNRNIIKESGEYILLFQETEIGGIKMPKIRRWYYNNDDKYLGTDTLLN